MTGGSQDRNRQPGTHKVHDSCVGHLPLCGESGSKAPKEMLTFTVDSTVRRTHKRSKHFIFVYFVRGGFRKMHTKNSKQVRESASVSGCTKVSCVRKVGPKDTEI